MFKRGDYMLVTVLALLVGVIWTQQAMAQRYESDNYTIDASVGNSFGGDTSSADYRLTSSGGESIIGNGAGGSYILGQGYVAQLERSLQLSVQPSGLVVYYGLDEAGDMAYDSSRYGNNANLLNNPSSQPGKIGQSRSFGPATNQALNIGNPSQLQTTDATISAWINTSQTSGIGSIIKKDQNYFIAINFRKLIVYDWSTSTSCSSTQELSDGQWHHVAVSIRNSVTDGTTMYIDGEKEADCTTTIVNNTQPVIIGNNAASSQVFNGMIDELKVFHRPMSAHEVKAEYEAGVEGVAAGLAFATSIVPGSSQTIEAEAVVLTDAPGYTLSVSQNNDLASDNHTIPSISGTIASPVVWSEGTTKGLGFTIPALSMGSVPAKWQSGDAYAGLPSTATSIYTRSGFGGGSKDVIGIRYRLDVVSSQPSEQYKNTVTYTGVIVP